MKQKIVKYVKLRQELNDIDVSTLKIAKADFPKLDEIYSIKKAFRFIGHSYKDTKISLHFNELSHGTLIGYDAKYFIPTNKKGNVIKSNNLFFKLSKNNMNISKTNKKDVNIIEINESHRKYVTSVSQKELNYNVEQANIEFDRWLRNDKQSICFIAIYDNKPVGLSVFDICNSNWPQPYIILHWVEKKFRDNDIGLYLSNKIFEWAKPMGYMNIFINTTNESKDCYLKQGWSIIKESHINNENFINMQFTLNKTLSFTQSKDINEFGPILAPLSEDFGTVFLHTVLTWCNIIPPNNPNLDKLWEVWLVKLGKQTIGICGLYTLQNAKDTSELWLGWLGITPEFRNLNLGKQIMDHLYYAAKKFGCNKLLSYVDKTGKPLNFYKREGFNIIGTVKQYCDANNIKNIDGEDFENGEDWVIEKSI